MRRRCLSGFLAETVGELVALCFYFLLHQRDCARITTLVASQLATREFHLSRPHAQPRDPWESMIEAPAERLIAAGRHWPDTTVQRGKKG